MAPVIRELRKYSAEGILMSVVCVTAQHREMLDQVLNLFEIHPDYDLNIMQENQSLSQVTAQALTSLDAVLIKENPDWVLVQGDTTTAMAAALVAFYHSVKVGHVEAGLRTWDKFHPFPEEINRKIADGICDLHFAPTKTARQNLLREGIPSATIHVTGNTVIDALQWAAALPFQLDTLKIPAFNDPSVRIILVTAHRRENFGAPLANICGALREIAECRTNIHIVYPVHFNPNVQEPVRRLLGHIANITLLPPLDYLPLVHLMKRSYLVLTDSGGLQEEAPSLGKPALVLRNVTERPEAVQAGTVRLIGTEQKQIVAETVHLLDDQVAYDRMAHAINPYGDGHAAERILEVLQK